MGDAVSGMLMSAILAEAFPTPQTIWTSWNLDPVLLLTLALALAVYFMGLRQVRAYRRYPHDTLTWRVVAYVSGILILVIGFVSPLDRLTTAVLWAHMLQYLLITVFAAPLLILAHPVPILLRGLPRARSRAVRHWAHHASFARLARTVLTNPYTIAGVDIGTLIFWHIPTVYEAGVRYEAVHVLELWTFLASGLLFWWAVRHPTAGPAMNYGRVLGCFVITSLASLAVGLLLFGSHSIVYPIYLDRTAAWNVSPRGDQQLAGVMLGVGPDLFDVLTFIVILARWVQSEGDAGIARL